MLLKKTLLLIALLAPCLSVTAHEYQAGELHIEHPWSREMPPVAPTAAVYFVVHNKSAQADRLLGAQTAVANAEALLHMRKEMGLKIDI
jgi:copper(I)-binding protein